MPSTTSDKRSSPAVERVTPALILRELRTRMESGAAKIVIPVVSTR